MLGVIIILRSGEGVTSFTKDNSANFSIKKGVKSRTRSRPQSLNLKVSNYYLRYPHCTVEPRFNEPLYNEVLGMTNDFLQPGRRCNKMYKTEPRFYEILFITNTIKKRNGKYNMSTCDRKIAKDECETNQ